MGMSWSDLQEGREVFGNGILLVGVGIFVNPLLFMSSVEDDLNSS